MDRWTELARARTGTGDELVLRECAGTVELRCNGWELMSNRAHHSETALAVLACERIAPAERAQQEAPPPPDLGPPCGPSPQGEGEYGASSRPSSRVTATAPHVLIAGLGLGYTLRAALNHLPRSARVTVVELLPEIIAWNQGPLAPFAGRPLDDPRVAIACAGVTALLRTTDPANFDAILLDTDNGPEAVMLPGNAQLYEPEHLTLIRRALRPAGILAVWSADPSPRFERNLRAADFLWQTHNVPARGAADDPMHTIYLAWGAA